MKSKSSKKIYSTFTLFLLTAISAFAVTTLKPGQLWLDDRGVHINAHGGGVMCQDGTYYWYGEHKSDSTSCAYVGVTCYSSKNLTDWKYEGVALKVDTLKGSDLEAGCILERPKVIYNKQTKKYVMWFHLELKGQGYNAARAGVAVSDKPEGPFVYLRSGRVNPRCYPLNTDAGFMDIFNRDFAGGQMARDMTLYVDDDGKAYHIYSSEDNYTLHIAELSEDYTSHTGRFARVAPGGHNEAPTIFKRGGRYWMITSGCTGWAPNEARMFTATDIWGPWEQLPSPCVGPDAKTTFGGQGTFILKVEGCEDSYIFMADIWRPKRPSDGRYMWLPISFKPDGVPVIHTVFNP